MPAPTNANYEVEYVRTLFDEFAPNYHLTGRFSFGLDDTIRRKAVAELQGKPIAICDMMSGSGQNWKFIKQRYPKAQITAVDFSTGMNAAAKTDSSIKVLQQCATDTSISDNCMDAVVCSFGIKTMGHEQQLAFCHEVLRLLKPGGQFVIVEFSKPKGGFALLYHVYFQLLLPLLLLFAGKEFRHHTLLKSYVDAFGDISALKTHLESRCQSLHRITYLCGLVTGIKGVK